MPPIIAMEAASSIRRPYRRAYQSGSVRSLAAFMRRAKSRPVRSRHSASPMGRLAPAQKPKP